MSSPYAGNDNFPESVTLPDDGDKRSAASVRVGLEGCLDRERWLKNRLLSRWAVVPLAAAVNINDRWAFNPHVNLDIKGGWQQIDTTDGGILWFPAVILAPPGASQITKLAVVSHGGISVGHAGLPGTMPRYRLRKVNDLDGAGGTLLDEADVATNLASYEQWHLNEYTLSTPEVLDDNSTFYVEVIGESGANAANSELVISQIRLFVEAVP